MLHVILLTPLLSLLQAGRPPQVAGQSAAAPAGAMLRWPALHFANPQLESSYQASRRRFLLQVDTWHGLLVLAYIPTWLALESQKWASPMAVPQTPACRHTCLSCKLSCACATFARASGPVGGLRRSPSAAACRPVARACVVPPGPQPHCSSSAPVGRLHLHAAAQHTLQLATARPALPPVAAGGCRHGALVRHVAPAAATALPYCATYWAGSSLLHQALSPPGLASASAAAAYPPGAQLLRLLAQLVVPVAVLYWLEKRSRKAFVAAQAREAAGGQGLQEQQLAGLPSSPIAAQNTMKKMHQKPQTLLGSPADGQQDSRTRKQQQQRGRNSHPQQQLREHQQRWQQPACLLLLLRLRTQQQQQLRQQHCWHIIVRSGAAQ
ncbi:hypothetical protein COO60DRAFT_179561 [Scenedesmus sp. NREL 46B-D3]|nr:hypothetical protein COO60DRAFT_179561 [Scenedesmus sp. NREL 46B-D3]